MKKCELCINPAMVHCESDQASLCWECDSKVHSANFLVAKHSRTLLCQVCQSPTPWTGSGPRLSQTITVCQSCVETRSEAGNFEGDDSNDGSDDDSTDMDGGDEDDNQSDRDEDDQENQVVP
ncbi:hypothetical protein Ancab_005087 [Ancistrocladus abbreviatus]